MANYKKSFNFRHGVQVDSDNFIVNANGLVGIGTTLPSQFLDVYGNAQVSEIITSKHSYVSGVSTFTTLNVGSAVTITSSSGIISATSYYGDGATLSNLPTSQWIDVDVGLGFTSIYAQGHVGIATTNPKFSLQIGGNDDVNNFVAGVGINSSGDIKATGVITSTNFDGTNLSVGVATITNLGVNGISTARYVNVIGIATLSNAQITALNASGISTFVNVSAGIITATTFSGNLTGDVTGDVVGNVTGVATGASALTGTPDIIVGIVTASDLNIGTSGTVFTTLDSGRIGVGTAIPGSEIQVRKPSGSLVEVISDSGESTISIGQSVGVGNRSAYLRYGNPAAELNLANNDTGSINFIIHDGGAGINTGNFKWFYGQTNNNLMNLTYDGKLGVGIANPTHQLHVVGTSTVTGNGSIGEDLNVGGGANIDGNLTVRQDISCDNLSATGLLASNVNVNTGISTFALMEIQDGLEVSVIGIGTMAGVNGARLVRGGETEGIDCYDSSALFGYVGVGTTALSGELYPSGLRSDLAVKGLITAGALGINTNSIQPGSAGSGVGINSSFLGITGSQVFADENTSVGIGTTNPRCVVDCSDAGKPDSYGAGLPTGRYFLPPIIENLTVKNGLSAVAGAIIYYVPDNKHQGYNGSTWNDLY